MSEIDEKTVQHVADLARIHVTPQELETLTKNLATILNYIDELKKVDTSGLPEISQVTGLKNVYREDVPVPERKKIIDGYLKVKAVFE